VSASTCSLVGAARDLHDLGRRQPRPEAVSGDELEDLQGGVVQVPAKPLAVGGAGGIGEVDAEQRAAALGALELAAQAPRVAICDGHEIGGIGGGIGELLEARDDVGAHAGEEAVARRGANAVALRPSGTRRIVLPGAPLIRRSPLPHGHHVPALSI